MRRVAILVVAAFALASCSSPGSGDAEPDTTTTTIPEFTTLDDAVAHASAGLAYRRAKMYDLAGGHVNRSAELFVEVDDPDIPTQLLDAVIDLAESVTGEISAQIYACESSALATTCGMSLQPELVLDFEDALEDLRPYMSPQARPVLDGEVVDGIGEP